jgi:hypothetical protein
MMFALKDSTSITDYYVGGPHVQAILQARRRHELYADTAFADLLIQEFEEVFENKKIRLLSMDVFDTVLLRNEKCELRRFFELGNRLAAEIQLNYSNKLSGWDFLVARLMSTKLSYRLSAPVKGCREGCLDEIHLGMCGLLGLDRKATAITVPLELEHESRETALNPLIPALLKLAREKNAQVVLMSDMYLRSIHIRSILETVAPGLLADTKVFSSGDLKISKRAGPLFDYICERESISAQQCLHVGDQWLSDFRMARQRGWNSVYLPVTHSEATALVNDERQFISEAATQGIFIAEVQ